MNLNRDIENQYEGHGGFSPEERGSDNEAPGWILFIENAPTVAKILLSAAAALLVAGSAYAALFLFFGERPPTEKPAQDATRQEVATSTADIPNNWKTYRNEEYGFAFKYPQEWTVRQDGSLEGDDHIYRVRIKKPLEKGISAVPSVRAHVFQAQSQEAFEEKLRSTQTCEEKWYPFCADVKGWADFGEMRFLEVHECSVHQGCTTSFYVFKDALSAEEVYAIELEIRDDGEFSRSEAEALVSTFMFLD